MMKTGVKFYPVLTHNELSLLLVQSRLLSACGDGILTNIILSVPPTANTENTNKALDFYLSWISSLTGVGDTVHIGMAPKNCVTLPNLDHQALLDKSQALDYIDQLLDRQPSTGNVVMLHVIAALYALTRHM